VELITDAEGRLERYLDYTGAHVFAVDFSPPLAESGESTYRIGLDDFHNLLSGTVRMARQGNDLLLDWQPKEPAWTRDYPLRTQLRSSGAGAFAMTVSKTIR
jgi:phenylacetate-coenzyme A ligase PaaK-like adenylate-forming protein